MKHYFHTNKYSTIDQKCFYACVKTRTENLPIHACGYLWHQKYYIVNKNHTRCVFHLLPIVYYKIFLGLHSTILHRKYWVQNVHRTCPGFLTIHIPRTLYYQLLQPTLPKNDLFFFIQITHSFSANKKLNAGLKIL